MDDPILDLYLRVRNKRLFGLRKQRGFTRDELAIMTGIPLNRIILAEQVRIILTNDEKSEISAALNSESEWIFPDELEVAIRDDKFGVRHKSLSTSDCLGLRNSNVSLLGNGQSEIEKIENSELSEIIEDVLFTLTPREQRVLQLRFGLVDGRSRTLEEVGKEFKVTRERIKQIEVKALRKLRHPYRSRKLKVYL